MTRTAAETRSEEHTSELQSPYELVCRLLLEKQNAGRASGQGARRAAQRDRPDRVGRSPAVDQYAPREVHAGGRLRDPARGPDAPRAVYDDDVGRERRLRCDHRSAQPNRQSEESPRMARKNDRRKPAAGARKGSGPGLAKGPAKPAGKAGKVLFKPTAAPPPPTLYPYTPLCL